MVCIHCTLYLLIIYITQINQLFSKKIKFISLKCFKFYLVRFQKIMKAKLINGIIFFLTQSYIPRGHVVMVYSAQWKI